MLCYVMQCMYGSLLLNLFPITYHSFFLLLENAAYIVSIYYICILNNVQYRLVSCTT